MGFDTGSEEGGEIALAAACAQPAPPIIGPPPEVRDSSDSDVLALIVKSVIDIIWEALYAKNAHPLAN